MDRATHWNAGSGIAALRVSSRKEKHTRPLMESGPRVLQFEWYKVGRVQASPSYIIAARVIRRGATREARINFS